MKPGQSKERVFLVTCLKLLVAAASLFAIGFAGRQVLPDTLASALALLVSLALVRWALRGTSLDAELAARKPRNDR